MTTTRTYDPPVWQSIWSDNVPGQEQANDWSGAYFSPADSSPLTFNDVANLSATHDFTQGDCWGGSLRGTINVTHNGVPQNVHVYYGDPGGVQSCTGAGQRTEPDRHRRNEPVRDPRRRCAGLHHR